MVDQTVASFKSMKHKKTHHSAGAGPETHPVEFDPMAPHTEMAETGNKVVSQGTPVSEEEYRKLKEKAKEG